MKKIIICLMFLSSAVYVGAQNSLWAAGSAVPGEPQQLEKRPDGLFQYTGVLSPGELKIMTTAEYQSGVTQFLCPQLVDTYLVNNGQTYVTVSDSARAGWVVSFQEDTYKFLVNTSSRTVRGELFLPWNEVLIAGSAHDGGSDNIEWKRDNMLPFTRDHNDPYVFTWTGRLAVRDGVIEPGRLKLEGQMTWGPRELHPYTQDEDILTSTQFRQGGDDTKWHVYEAGVYRITVDLYNETIQAVKL
jgi:hypothetical protein